MKMITRKKKQDKSYKKDKKFLKKKPYGQAHIGQEWNSSNESSELERDDLQPLPSRVNLHQESHSSQTFSSTHVS
jgi:hypothetical protein